MNVIWLAIREENPPRGYWDHGLLECLFERFACAHLELRAIPEGLPGAVVVVPARNQASDVAAINEELAKLPWCVVILTGDEESVFPWRELRHPSMRVWVMSPKQGQHDDAANRIGSGYRYEQPALAYKNVVPERDTDLFFAGQITHAIRRQMSEQLHLLADQGEVALRVHETAGFGQGLSHADYVEGLMRARFVPAPSGPVSPDNFRLYEALEAGCVPIADGGGYWPYLFGETPPFPIVSSWEALPAILPELLKEWPACANRTYAWWQLYKRKMADKLSDHVLDVSGQRPEPANPSDVTVLMPTSYIPSHPSTAVIDRTIASVRERLPNAEIILMIDALKPEHIEHKVDYETYVQRLLWKTNNEYDNVTPLLFETFSHQSLMTKQALRLVRTPLVLFVEHDTPLYGDMDWDGLRGVVEAGYAHIVRLHHETRIIPDHEHLMLDKTPRSVMGVPLLRSIQWSQRPHLASTEFYRRIAEKYWDDEPRFIEHIMYGVVLANDWSHFRLHIFAPDGNMLRSTHLDGRRYQESQP